MSTTLPLPNGISLENFGVSEADWAATPPSVKELVAILFVGIAELHSQVAALTAELGELNRKQGELEEKLRQNSSNSSRPPSSDGPKGAAKSKPANIGSKRKRGGQPGHKGHKRELLPVEQVDEIRPVVLVQLEWDTPPDLRSVLSCRSEV